MASFQVFLSQQCQQRTKRLVWCLNMRGSFCWDAENESLDWLVTVYYSIKFRRCRANIFQKHHFNWATRDLPGVSIYSGIQLHTCACVRICKYACMPRRTVYTLAVLRLNQSLVGSKRHKLRTVWHRAHCQGKRPMGSQGGTHQSLWRSSPEESLVSDSLTSRIHSFGANAFGVPTGHFLHVKKSHQAG